jgi:hypothetical protein
MEHKGRYVPASGTYLVTVTADGAEVSYLVATDDVKVRRR